MFLPIIPTNNHTTKYQSIVTYKHIQLTNTRLQTATYLQGISDILVML